MEGEAGVKVGMLGPQVLGLLFRTRWAKTTPKQRQLLEAMATSGGDDAARSEIAERLGVDSNTLSRPREELISRGLIEPAGHGRLRFTIPGFGDFVRAQELNVDD